ncbi:MAG TPA: HesA/MoeB/ThiF family protein [Anaerolineaceae bacterium]|nr:HesA/MoeB/ThiF family protein [Anaerolineaceae bacterium]HOF28846.1 HesA/MoeB/ThiF family protein [Anaerolineaceae bacterium]
MERYLRNHDALSLDEQEKLASKRVLIVGCGGLGGVVIECLARIGVGHMRVVDGDVFDESNLNRQLLSSRMNLGRPKTLAAQQRVMAVNPLVEVEAVQAELTAKNALELLAGCDAAVDCLDNIPSRLLLQQAAKEAGIPLVHAAIAGWRGQVAVVQPGEDLLSLLYNNSRQEQGEEISTGTLSFTAAALGALQASEVVKLLLGRQGLQGELLILDLLNASSTRLRLT